MSAEEKLDGEPSKEKRILKYLRIKGHGAGDSLHGPQVWDAAKA